MIYTKKYTSRLIAFILLALFLAAIILLSYYYGPEGLVEKIGTKNGYISAAIVAFFGGFSAFTSVSYYSVLITLVSGGLNPWMLGIIAGISLSIGDTLMFILGKRGRDIITGKLEKNINRLAAYMNNKKKIQRFIPLLSWLYLGFVPLPNDWLLLFLAAVKYPNRKMFPVIVAGDITFALMLCLVFA